ncbi:MAG: M55 family metallopeptidase [Oscillospiraceae bacterium]|nr:M55 family metallopeptidase [Oscillospiraceae bacterium]
MRVYISVDLEGVNGVVHPEQVLPEHPEYERTQRWLLEEINSCVRGLKSAGVEHITLNDSHHSSRNVIIDGLDPIVELMSGDTRPYSMMNGIDSSYDAAILLGYHAKAGTHNAVLDHSYYPLLVRDIRVNGRSCGEIGLSALYAGAVGVPVVMLSGDAAAAAEINELLPACKTAAVKKATGRFGAVCMPMEKSRALIEDSARAAISALPDMKPIAENMPACLEIEFVSANMADGAAMIPGTNVVDSRTVSIECGSMDEVFLWRQVMCIMAQSCADKRF